ncbi:hypothetical protein M409DRAFT_22953 [Zasmidium cellare ATCC 36951]|uniref:WW domain-containing protein n=1 Tax=Zasmidium cellare ATCC 36951 TaxID=1080233 RepID=A0A6A6CIP5_ZASCE|nr:uncharacterized protein M409DRAFT_22953 [Zasmidium cellare ATCC 36951]KAF2166901.1 hypothetical protein M409DRAFT_22953 [Zasmidium cellare ATCC 36951]
MDVTPSSLPEIPEYQYATLNHSIKETRLAELLPGKYDDDIHLKIHCVSLSSSNGARPELSGFAVGDLQKDLPPDWTVRETINGRFIFERKKDYRPDEPYETSWEHPKAKFEPVPNNYNLLHTKPQYEALSHAWGPKEDQTVVIIEQTSTTIEYSVESDANHSRHKDNVTNESNKRSAEDCTIPQSAKRSKIRNGENDIIAGEYISRACFDNEPEIGISCLSIQSELATALRHLRHKNRSRMLWVDNICINQDDVSERSHLVRHMGHIYKLAQKVIVWIGPEYDDSKRAMSKLEYLGRQVEITNQGSWRVNAPGCLEPNWSRTAVPLPYDRETW